MTKQQIEAFEKFKRLKVGALFMKMGTGKTKVALELVNYNNVDLMVYVCPFSVINNVDAEIHKWGVNCRYLIIGYETLSASDKTYMELLNYLEGKRTFIVADESIFLKNDKTKRYKRLCEIRKKCEYAIILNGTPITKNEFDLYNQMEFLSPLIMKMSRQEFLNTFFKKITYKKKHQLNEHTFYKFSEVNAEALKTIVKPYIFECDLEFDKKENSEYNYIPYQDDGYYLAKEEHLKQYMEYGNSETIINMLVHLNNLASTYQDKNDAVIEYIKSKQVVVFCNYLEEVDYIKKRCKCYVITGETKDRQSIIEAFKKDSKPLLLTFGCGAYSLNLQFCNEIVYSSINFDYAKFEQSRYRIKRMGQQSDIKYTYFLTDLGINHLILKNLEKKQSLEDLIKEKMMKGDNEWLKNI